MTNKSSGIMNRKICFNILMLILINISCDSEGKEDCKVNSNIILNFLIENTLLGFDKSEIGEYIDSNKCFLVEEFIEEQNFKDSIANIFSDTLFMSIGVPVFKDFVEHSKNESEIIRLVRLSFAFNKNEILFVEGEQNMKNIKIFKKIILFDKRCSTLVFNGEKPFTQSCFQVIDSMEKTVSENEWIELNNVIEETDFVNTVYKKSSDGTICDGYDYIVNYSRNSNIESVIETKEKSCPGKRSPIFLVSEKLIELINRK